MTTIDERAARMTRILSDVEVDAVWTESHVGAALADGDGDRICVLPVPLVALLGRSSDVDAGAILVSVVGIVLAESRRAFADGKVVGHQETVMRVHELLGIDRICNAIAEVAEADGG